MGCGASANKYGHGGQQEIVAPDLPKEDRLGSYRLESPDSRVVESSSERDKAVKVGTIADDTQGAGPIVNVLELIVKSYADSWILRGRVELQDAGGSCGWVTVAKFSKTTGKLMERLASTCEEEPKLLDHVKIIKEEPRRPPSREEIDRRRSEIEAHHRGTSQESKDAIIILYDRKRPQTGYCSIICGDYDGRGGCKWLKRHDIRMVGAQGRHVMVAFSHGSDSIICIYDPVGLRCIFGRYNGGGGCDWYKEQTMKISASALGCEKIVAFTCGQQGTICINKGSKCFFGKYDGQGGCRWHDETSPSIGSAVNDRIVAFIHDGEAITCIYRPADTKCCFGKYDGCGGSAWYGEEVIGNFAVTPDYDSIVACSHRGAGIICVSKGQSLVFGMYNGCGGCDWYKEHYADLGSVANSCNQIFAFNYHGDAHICIHDPRKQKFFFGKYNGQGGCKWHNQHNPDIGPLDYNVR